MNRVNRLSPLRAGHFPVSLYLALEREGREDIPPFDAKGLCLPTGCRGGLRASFPPSMKQAENAAFQPAPREKILGMLSRTR